MIKNIHTYIPPCKEIPPLIEKKIAKQISIKEKIQLKIHLKICKTCQQYNEKTTIIDKILTKNTPQNININNHDIQQIKNNIQKKIKK